MGHRGRRERVAGENKQALGGERDEARETHRRQEKELKEQRRKRRKARERTTSSVGVPKTEQILCIWSGSLEPGKSGRNVYSSATMVPIAQTSMGEL
jgi:hypothetical protein